MDMITVEKRDFAVKAKKLRRLGLVPGSVFGGPLREALALQLEEADARRLVEQKREGSKLKIVLDGQQIPVQIKEKAVNLLNNDILHLSFQALQADQKVNSVIHIFLTNTEKVTDALERMLMEIPYASLPEDMIDTITVDVEGMPCGTVLTVGDIPELNSGKLDLQADKTEIVLRISDKTRGPSRAAKPFARASACGRKSPSLSASHAGPRYPSACSSASASSRSLLSGKRRLSSGIACS